MGGEGVKKGQKSVNVICKRPLKYMTHTLSQIEIYPTTSEETIVKPGILRKAFG